MLPRVYEVAKFGEESEETWKRRPSGVEKSRISITVNWRKDEREVKYSCAYFERLLSMCHMNCLYPNGMLRRMHFEHSP